MPESDRRHVDDPSEASHEPVNPGDGAPEAEPDGTPAAAPEAGTAPEPDESDEADKADAAAPEAEPDETPEADEAAETAEADEPDETAEADEAAGTAEVDEAAQPDETAATPTAPAAESDATSDSSATADPNEAPDADEAAEAVETGETADSPEAAEAAEADEAGEAGAPPDPDERAAPEESEETAAGPDSPGDADHGEGIDHASEADAADHVEGVDHAGEADDAGDAEESPGRTGKVLRRVSVGLVLLLLAVGAASYAFDLGPRWLGWDYAAPGGPAAVAPPPGLRLPAARPPEPVAEPVADQGADPAAVRRALAAVVRDKLLGTHAAVRVAELRGPHAGTEVFAHGPDLVTPASTLKLLTTTAALAALGPDHRFTTKVVAGPTARTVTLVGGGDPLLASKPVTDDAYPPRADVVTLARQTARALQARGRSKVHLHYDSSLFTGPAVSPHWEPSYVPDVVSPISALWVDEGRDPQGSADPAAAAADAFAHALRKQGVKVVGKPVAAVAPRGATALTEVQGAPLSEVVQYVLETSDNDGAEVLARQTALATGRPASFLGGAAAVRARLRRLGVPLDGVTTYDGSGLSRHDRVRPDTLLRVLETDAAPDHPGLRTVVTGLPVAGFTGSLTLRFQHAPRAGLGVVRAKTGTLTGVHGLAGTVLTRDGTLLAFVAVADRVKLPNTLGARDDLDKIAAALAACTCGATP